MKKDDFDQEFFEALKTVITRLDDLDSITCSSWVKVLIERSEKLCKKNTPELTPLEFIQSWAEMFNTPKLKPCPFCGEPAQLLEDEGSTGHWRTRCNNSMCLIVLCSVVFPTKRQAAEAWNTRGNNE